MEFVIATGPTGMRNALADDLAQDFADEIAVKMWNPHEDPYMAGVNTDYRHAMRVAVSHAVYEAKGDLPILHSHSLLDSLAYATLTVERHAKFENVNEYTRNKWWLTFGLIGCMLRDSFKADAVFFINWFELEDDGYEVQERIRLILDEFQIRYRVFEPLGSYDDLLAEVAGALREELNGAGRASSEPTQG